MKYTGQYIVSRNINDCRFDLPFTLLSGVNDNTRVKPSCKGRKNLKTKKFERQLAPRNFIKGNRNSSYEQGNEEIPYREKNLEIHKIMMSNGRANI